MRRRRTARAAGDRHEGGGAAPGLSLYPGERVWFARPRGLPGVEVMHARRSPRLWKVWHDTYTLCIAYDVDHAGDEGGAFWTYRGRALTVQGGWVMLMEPGEVHVTKRVVGAGSFDVFMVQPGIVEQLASELGVPMPVHLSEACTADPELFCAVEALARGVYLQHDRLAQEPRLLRVLWLLLSRYVERGAKPPEPLSRRQVRRAYEFIDAHYMEPIDLAALAAACGVGKSSVTHGLPKALGVTPGELHDLRRLREARRLLAAGHAAGEAAAIAGYSDQAQLTRHFRRAWGITPGRYARMVR